MSKQAQAEKIAQLEEELKRARLNTGDRYRDFLTAQQEAYKVELRLLEIRRAYLDAPGEERAE